MQWCEFEIKRIKRLVNDCTTPDIAICICCMNALQQCNCLELQRESKKQKCSANLICPSFFETLEDLQERQMHRCYNRHLSAKAEHKTQTPWHTWLQQDHRPLCHRQLLCPRPKIDAESTPIRAARSPLSQKIIACSIGSSTKVTW